MTLYVVEREDELRDGWECNNLPLGFSDTKEGAEKYRKELLESGWNEKNIWITEYKLDKEKGYGKLFKEED